MGPQVGPLLLFFPAWVSIPVYKILRQIFALQVLLGLILACPNLAHAATVSGQIALNTDDADQDGIGSTTQLFDGKQELGLVRHFGLRFTGLAIPDNAVILNASIQFTAESSGTSGSPSNRIVGEAADNASTFVEATNNITDRTTTAASVIWNIPSWPTGGESGPAQQTPDISAIIQEIVDRSGWTSGNALALIFEPNSGDEKRLAWTYDGSPADAAILQVEYVACPGGIVTTTTDSTTGTSLRACVIWANLNPGTDTLTLPAGTYTLSIAGTGEDAAATGDLDITEAIVINGNAVSATIIDANAIDRVFHILGVGMTASNLTVRNGNVTSNGGGIALDATASATLTASTLSGNTASGGDGGGIQTAGGTVTLTNVTMNGNTADEGGGLSCRGPCTLTNVTVTANTGVVNGGGVHQRTGAGSITFLNTIVANNSSPLNDDCKGNASLLISNGYNLSSDATCDFTNTGDLQNTNPLLGPLQDNGGPTFTHELLAGSPAIDAGTTTGCPATDQRGVARPAFASCDIGAYEGDVALPALLVMKATFTLEDPVNGTTNPKAIPGATERYLIEVTNTGPGTVDTDTMFISDPIPVNMALRVIDYDGGNPGPVAFVDGSPVSGLTYTFTSLGSSTDDVEFSNDGGSTWTYTPVDSGDGTDPAVTDIRINPKGIFAASGGGGDPSFQARFKAVVQ